MGLQLSMSYDVVCFVTDVSGSNAVFGLVRSVLRSATHLKPPTATFSVVHTANGSATSVEAKTTLSAPGKFYLALVPSAAERHAHRQLPSPSDLVNYCSFWELPRAFAMRAS